MMPRGGKRPGSGAPKDNLNALKHGQRSKQFARLGAVVAASPAARKALLRLADRFDADQRKADKIADHVFEQILSRGIVRGRDRLILLPELLDEERTIRQGAPEPPSPQSSRTKTPALTPPNNQSPHAGDHAQSENPDENRND